MNPQHDNQAMLASEEDEISVLDLLQTIAENIKLLVLGPLLVGLAALGISFAIAPTYTANTILWSAGVNQRATYRWVAAPGSELLIPATASNGIGVAAKSAAYTGDALASVMFAE